MRYDPTRRHFLTLSLTGGGVATSFLLSGFAWGQPPVIGKIRQVQGQAWLWRGKQKHAADVGMEIFQADRLTTHAQSRLLLVMSDETEIMLGDHSDFTPDRFLYDPTAGQADILYRLGKGVFRMVTGASAALARQSGGQFRVKTPIATVGIRGTDFWGQQSATRLDLALLSGGPVTLQNQGGSVLLTEAPFVSTVTDPVRVPTMPRALTREELSRAVASIQFNQK